MLKSQWSFWEGGPDKSSWACQAIQSTYMGHCGEGGWRLDRVGVGEWGGSVAVCLPVMPDPVKTNAKVLYKQQANHHFPSSVTLSSARLQRMLLPKTNTWRKWLGWKRLLSEVQTRPAVLSLWGRKEEINLIKKRYRVSFEAILRPLDKGTHHWWSGFRFCFRLYVPPTRLKLMPRAAFAQQQHFGSDLISQKYHSSAIAPIIRSEPLALYRTIKTLRHFHITELLLWTRNMTSGPVWQATCSLHLRLVCLHSQLPYIARETCYRAWWEASRSQP